MFWFRRTVIITEGGFSIIPVIIGGAIFIVLVKNGATIAAAISEAILIVAIGMAVIIGSIILGMVGTVAYKVGRHYHVGERVGDAIIERVKDRKATRGRPERTAIEPSAIYLKGELMGRTIGDSYTENRRYQTSRRSRIRHS
jgi:hypothetical protein